MSIHWIIIWALLILASIGLIVWRLVWPMSSSTHRTILIVLAIAGAIIGETLLIVTAMIPKKVDTLLTYGITGIEAHLEETNPGYCSSELTTEELQSVLSDTKTLNAYIDNSPDMGFAIRMIGAGAYLGYIKTFTGSIERNLQDMRDNGTPITLHNVMLRIQEKSHAPVMKTTKVLEILVIIVCILFILALLIAYFILKKNEDDMHPPRVIVVEQKDESQ